jgi:hypothetical protein
MSQPGFRVATLVAGDHFTVECTAARRKHGRVFATASAEERRTADRFILGFWGYKVRAHTPNSVGAKVMLEAVSADLVPYTEVLGIPAGPGTFNAKNTRRVASITLDGDREDQPLFNSPIWVPIRFMGTARTAESFRIRASLTVNGAAIETVLSEHRYAAVWRKPNDRHGRYRPRVGAAPGSRDERDDPEQSEARGASPPPLPQPPPPPPSLPRPTPWTVWHGPRAARAPVSPRPNMTATLRGRTPAHAFRTIPQSLIRDFTDRHLE